MTRSPSGASLTRHYEYCLFCNGRTYVLAPPDASELDVMAEFSSAGRAFGSYDDVEGVACYRCARERWKDVPDE